MKLYNEFLKNSLQGPIQGFSKGREWGHMFKGVGFALVILSNFSFNFLWK